MWLLVASRSAARTPISTLSARFSRAPALKNIRGQGWWIRDEADGSKPTEAMPPALFERRGFPAEPDGPVGPEPSSDPDGPGGSVAHDNMTDKDG